MTDEQLLAAWYRDRGTQAKRESAAVEKQILPALRERFLAEREPRQRHLCAVCSVLTRGGGHRTKEAAA